MSTKLNKELKQLDSSMDKIFLLFFILCLIVILAAGIGLYHNLKNYSDSDKLYEDLNDTFSNVPATEGEITEEIETEYPEVVINEDYSWVEREFDVQGLLAQNRDTAGWLYFEDGGISYPVMYSGDNSKYLHNAFNGSYAYAGCIFIDGNNVPDLRDFNTMIHGHNMRNGSMFGSLKNYYNKKDYYKEHRYFQFFTEDYVYRFKIFAYEKTDISSFIYKNRCQTEEECDNFIRSLKGVSLIPFDDVITSQDTIITLSTCTSGNGRFAVHGILVSAYDRHTENINLE